MLYYIVCIGKLQRLHCSPEAWDDGECIWESSPWPALCQVWMDHLV